MKTTRLFFAWNYEKELKLVNERSAAGWHLTGSTAFSRTEEQDAARRYCYRLDARQDGGFTELLYEKQGWELVCRQGPLLWFRKERTEGAPETVYELHGGERHAIADLFRRRIRPLDTLRNLLLVLAFLLILVPGSLTGGLTPRIACVPLFLCLLPVRIAENYRKALGEHKRA